MTEVANTPSVSPAVATAAALAELEFERVLDVVARRAVSDLGAEAVRHRRPITSVPLIEAELTRVAQLAGALRDGGGFSPIPVPDLTGTLDALGVPGGVLEAAALTQLARALEGMRKVRAALLELEPDAPAVAALAVEIPPRGLEQALNQALEPEGSVKEDASPEIRKARRRVRDVRDRLVAELRGLARQMADAGVAADDADVTVRGGRYVIPVRRDARSRIEGIVHDESSSGATLFVEPVRVVSLGNDLRAAEADEARAVLALLRALTERARAVTDLIEAGWRMCIRVDDLYARARYMVDVDGHVPAVEPAPGTLRIRRGFHPLVLEESPHPVPFDLDLAVQDRTLLVSGPNAGGKTVLLKAIALSGALVQSGVVPPVGPKSQLPIFGRIFVDIGDHQSIAESLSTFSARITTLRGILQETDDASLVLIDEVGAGTDPFEGAALASAVLTALTRRGTTTVATTHLSQLKDLAAREQGFVNASLQFDSEQLSPTYRFQQGKPGRSYGLAIARRLGFPTEVLELAERLVPESVRRLEAALADVEAASQALEAREATLAAAEARLEKAQRVMERAQGELTRRVEEIERREVALEREGREQARRFLLEARKRVEEALGVARAAVSEATAKEARRLVEDGVRAEADALARLAGRGWRLTGQREKGARKLPSQPAAPTPKVGMSVPMEATATEIDLRGLTAAEAEAAVVSAIDGAVMADLPMLRIIHGKGTGVLRATVVQILKRDRRVSAYRLAPPLEGGSGVTIAEFGS